MASESSSSSPHSPPPSQWSTMEQLLNSSTGKNLFLDYLRNEDEGLSVPMLFLLAVEGLHGVAEETNEDQKMVSAINLIYEELLPSVSCLSERVIENVRLKITTPDVTIYDEALDEIREHLSMNLYPNFLKSEFYLAAINHELGAAEQQCNAAVVPDTDPYQAIAAGPSNLSPVQAETSSYRCRGDLLTVHEEEVVSSFKRQKPFMLTEDHIWISQHHRAKKGTKSAHLNPYHAHAQYSSYNPVSRQDSEIQSISSGHITDESTGKSRARLRATQDNLPRVANPPKRADYNNRNYLTATDKPKEFAKQLIQKLEALALTAPEDRLPKYAVDLGSHSNKSHPARPAKQNVFGPGIDNKTLTTHLRKLEEASNSEGARYLGDEQEQDVQAILDQHVKRVWKDSTTPEFSRSPRNETIGIDSRKARKPHHSLAPPSHTTALIKGKSMQTLDSGIGGDKDCRKVRLLAPVPRWTNKQFIDVVGGDAGRSTGWDAGIGQSNPERPKSGDLPLRGAPVPMRGGPSQQLLHRRHSPPHTNDDAVSVLVHYEFEHEKPFLIKISKSKLTLGYLKSKVPKKGNWKYLFKLGDADDRNKLINYELKRDEEILPMFRDECVIVILKSIPPPEMNNVV